jgi:hypothetical protein
MDGEGDDGPLDLEAGGCWMMYRLRSSPADGRDRAALPCSRSPLLPVRAWFVVTLRRDGFSRVSFVWIK